MSEKTPKKANTVKRTDKPEARAAKPSGERKNTRPAEKAAPKRSDNRGRAASSSQWRAGGTDAGKKPVALLAILCAVAIGIGILGQTGITGTLGRTEESPVRISEVLTSNASALIMEDGSLPDWIEIENNSETPVELSGYCLMIESDPTSAYTFGHSILQPGEQLIVYADNNMSAKGYHAPFKLSASGETIALLDKGGDGADMVEVPELNRDQAWARDVAGNWKKTDMPTPGNVNRIETMEEMTEEEIRIAVQPGDLKISEVMSGSVTWFADESGQCHDYIEIYNGASQNVNLEGWYLTDSKDKLLRWQFPNVTVPAGGYLAVHCSGYDRKNDANHLHTGFKLSSDGDTIILTNPDGVSVDMLAVPVLEADQAYSLVNGSWTRSQTPTPGAANSLEGAAMQADQMRMASGSQVYITEVLATSSKSEDWVEVHNASSQAVDISGWGLSDNANRPRKWQFPAGTVIQPGQYIGVFTTGNDVVSGGNMHTNFRLSADGGYSLTLADPAGNILDRIYMGPQYENISYGRMDGHTGLRYFETVTPGTANTGISWAGRASSPTYSVEGGLFKTGDVFTVSMTAEPGQKIYYTLDYTDPTQNSTLYTGPITISETTVLRTRVYGNDRMESFMDTQSYLYDVNNGNGTVFVVSLVSDPYNLTSDEAGIMVKGPNATKKYPFGAMNQGANFWMDWEREAHVEVFNPDGSTMLSQGCGIKLHGQYSRAEDQKAFKVIARSKYGENRFNAPIFSKRDYTEYQSFLLRASGQDTDKTRMRDSVISALAAGTSVLYQETEVCVVYLDGQYWGHYNMRERINPHCVCQFEGWEGDEDKIDLIKANSNVMQGSNATFAKLLEWVKKNNTNTDAAYELIGSVIDIQNFIEYMAIEMYTGNTDTLNVKRYRNANADGKWRWVLFDLDWAFHEDTNSVRRWLAPGGMGNGLRTDNTLFIACMKNAKFRDQFLTHLGQRMATDFSAESMLARFEERYKILEPLLADHLSRWNMKSSQITSGMKKLINYAKSRPYRMLQFLKYAEALGLSQKEMEHYFGGTMAAVGVTYKEIKALEG